MENIISEAIKEYKIDQRRVYAVLLFYTEMELGISNIPNKWVCTNVFKFEKGEGGKALDFYTNTPCPASQLIDAENDEELNSAILQMKKNYQDKDWLNKYLYPYL